MPRLVRTRLSAMMFMFYFSLGSWMVTLSTYLMSAPTKGGLNFTTEDVGLIYSSFAFGGIIAPLMIGLLTDRLFCGERVLGATSLIAAALLASAALWCDANTSPTDVAYRTAATREHVDGEPALVVYERLGGAASHGATDDPVREELRHALDRVNDDPAVRQAATNAFRPLFGIMLAYCVVLQIALTVNTVVTLRNLPDPTHDFSRVRLFGTVGWVVAGNAIGWMLRPVSTDILYLGAAGSAAMGLYALSLPRTPPMGTGRSVAEAFGLPALRLLKDRSFVVFVLVALVSTALNQFYIVYGHRYLTDLGVPAPVQLMTIAQVVEVACMFVLPLLRPKDRMKWLMAVGLAGYALRGMVMTIGWVPAVVAIGVPMHGWGYAFFMLVASTYLDREAPPHLRASAQGIITFISGGVGVWAGNMFAGWVVDANRVGTVVDWHRVWQVPLVGCTVILLAFIAFFRPPTAVKGKEEELG